MSAFQRGYPNPKEKYDSQFAAYESLVNQPDFKRGSQKMRGLITGSASGKKNYANTPSKKEQMQLIESKMSKINHILDNAYNA